MREEDKTLLLQERVISKLYPVGTSLMEAISAAHASWPKRQT